MAVDAWSSNPVPHRVVRHRVRQDRRWQARGTRHIGEIGRLPALPIGKIKGPADIARQQQRADMGVGDVEVHVWRVGTVATIAYPASAVATASAVRPASPRMFASTHAVSAPIDRGQFLEDQVLGVGQRDVRTVGREPVHRADGIDAAAGTLGREMRCAVDDLLSPCPARRAPTACCSPVGR